MLPLLCADVEPHSLFTNSPNAIQWYRWVKWLAGEEGVTPAARTLQSSVCVVIEGHVFVFWTCFRVGAIRWTVTCTLRGMQGD